MTSTVLFKKCDVTFKYILVQKMCEQRAAASNVTSNFTVDGVDITRNYAQKNSNCYFCYC